MFVKREVLFAVPARQINQPGVDAMQAEQLCSIGGTVDLTQAGQHLSHGLQVIGQGKMPVLAQAGDIFQYAFGVLQSVQYEIVGFF